MFMFPSERIIPNCIMPNKANTKKNPGGGMTTNKKPRVRRGRTAKQAAVAREYAPTSKGMKVVNLGARISGSGDVVRIAHREYIADVTTTLATFETRVFKINPGVATTFPWLSNIAANFEKYRFRKLKFCYYSSVATTTAGSVMLAIDLDTLDAPPASKQQMLQMQRVVRANVWEECCSFIPEAVPELYIRTGAVPVGADAKTYDAGQLIIGTVGTTAATIGEAWFEYDVELHTPQSTQAAVATATLTTPDGDFTDSVILGSLRAVPTTAVNVEVFTQAGLSYIFVMTSQDALDNLNVLGGTLVYSSNTTGTGTSLYTGVRIVTAGVAPLQVLVPASVVGRKLLVSPIQTI